MKNERERDIFFNSYFLQNTSDVQILLIIKF